MAKKNRRPTLIISRGLPASGKSLYAKQTVENDENTIRVNKDSIRGMVGFIGNGRRNKKQWGLEKYIQEIEIQSAKIFLQAGYDVIVDDTNLDDKHVEMWKNVASSEKAAWKVESFLHVPVEECIRRDAVRTDPVGAGIIYGMAVQANLIESANEKVSLTTPYIVCDLDGTLFDIDHRLHYISDGNADWESFFAAMMDDTPREHVVSLIKDTYADLPCVIVTGRPEPYRTMCVDQLTYWEIPYHSLLMRKPGDRRPDNIVKQEILNDFLNKDLIQMWIDDRPIVIRQVQANNIPVCNVGDGREF